MFRKIQNQSKKPLLIRSDRDDKFRIRMLRFTDEFLLKLRSLVLCLPTSVRLLLPSRGDTPTNYEKESSGSAKQYKWCDLKAESRPLH